VADFVHPDSFTPVTGDAHGRLSTGHAVVGVQPSGSSTIASPGRTPMWPILLERCSNLNMISCTFGKALLSRLSAPAAVAGREGRRTQSVSWRCDGR
jgi:hypothetical protein